METCWGTHSDHQWSLSGRTGWSAPAQGVPLFGSSSEDPTVGCDSVIKPSRARARRPTEVGVPYQKGSCRLEGGLCRPSTLAPGFLHRAHFSALLSFSPSFQTPAHTCTRLPVLCAPPRPRTHPSVHARIGALRRPSPHLCTLIHLCTPAPTHWVSS